MRAFEETMKLNLSQFGYCLTASEKVRAHMMDSATIMNRMMMNGLIRFIQEDEPLK